MDNLELIDPRDAASNFELIDGYFIVLNVLDLSQLKQLLRDESAPVEIYVKWLENIFTTQVLQVTSLFYYARF